MACYLRVLKPFDPRLLAHAKILGDLGADPHGDGFEFRLWTFFEQTGAKLHAMGFDGIWMRENDGEEFNTLAVFDSSQIKSATDNSGAFRTGKNITASGVRRARTV